MYYLNHLSLGLNKKIPVILQTEASECGLACLAMIASYYGYNTDLLTLRQKHQIQISQKGATLSILIKIANKLNLTTRPLKLDLNSLKNLRRPCILHWNLNHFVILKDITLNKITIIDPAFGERTLTYDQVSSQFTGISLELWPNSNFEEKKDKIEISIFKLFGEIRGLWKSFGQIFILALSLEIFLLISPFFMQWVVDQAIVSSDTNLLTTLALGFSILIILSSLTSLLQDWIIMYMATTLNIQWKANIFNHLINLPNTFFQKRHLGDIVSRFESIDSIQKTLTTSFISSIIDGLMTILTLILMFFYSVKLALIVLISIIIYALIRWALYTPLKQATEEQIIHNAKQHTNFMETMRGIKTIKQFNKQEYRQTNWLNLLVDEINSELISQKLNLFFKLLNNLLFGLQNIIVIWVGANLVLGGDFTVGVLIAFIAYKNQFSDRVKSLIDKYIELKMLNLHSERLADIVLTPQENVSNNILYDDKIDNSNIEVKSLHFKYYDEENWIINNISFSIPSKQSIAIIGPTGCGKTTLMNLLLGNLKYEHGDIIIGEKSLKNIDHENLRNLVALVSQDDVLFSGSIQENISFFDNYVQQDWVEKCAKMTSIHNEIIAMPMGYQTLVGDMGNFLSGGQKQRILLARALYKKPKILFLDEATSHLDILKEQEINNTIKSLDITRIIIAHRPETIKSVDRVIVLNNGKIIDDQLITPK